MRTIDIAIDIPLVNYLENIQIEMADTNLINFKKICEYCAIN